MHVAFANAQVKKPTFHALFSSRCSFSLSLSLSRIAVDKKKGMMRASLSCIDLIDFEHVFLRQQKKRN